MGKINYRELFEVEKMKYDVAKRQLNELQAKLKIVMSILTEKEEDGGTKQ
jgi:hypothetical protein